MFERCGYYAVFAVVVALLILDLTLRLAITGKRAGTSLNSTAYWHVEQSKQGSQVLVASEAITSLWEDSIEEKS